MTARRSRYSGFFVCRPSSTNCRLSLHDQRTWPLGSDAEE